MFLNKCAGSYCPRQFILQTYFVKNSSLVQDAIDDHHYVQNLFGQLIQGQRSALSRSITLVESRHPVKQARAQSLVHLALNHLRKPRTQRQLTRHLQKVIGDASQHDAGGLAGAFRIGITGPPGAGKSSLLEVLCGKLTEHGLRVAVLAIDPSSVLGGGSLLGDKTRMSQLSRNPMAFVRPSPTAGAPGGIARGTAEAAVLCEAAGYEVIFVETVGVGQSEVGVADLVDCFCLILPPAAGDELQGIKKGVMEVADVVAVSKCDGQLMAEARRVAADYTSALKFVRPRAAPWRTPVLTCSVLDGQSVDHLWSTLINFYATLMSSSHLIERRREQRRIWMWRHVKQRLLEQLAAAPGVEACIAETENAVLEGLLTPAAGADILLAAFYKERLKL